MKEVIIAAFKKMFPGVNLSKVRLAEIAKKVEAKIVDDETKIDATLKDLNENGFQTFAELAKMDDKLREAKPPKEATPKKEGEADPKTEVVPPVTPDDTPEWMKTWMKQQAETNKTLLETVGKLQTERAQTTVRQKADKDLAGVPAKFWQKLAIPEKEEDYAAWVEEVKTDYTEFTKELTGQDIKILPQPANGTGGKQNPADTKVDDSLKAHFDKIDKTAAQTVKQ